MFKGTRRFPANVLDKTIARDGGLWNAMTWIDWTAYFETMPADRIDLGLRLEADRMTHSLFPPKEVASERTVIISERQGHENSPAFLLSEEIHAAAFRIHPYRHEVIGDQADLETMTRDALYDHYRRHYAPNNAVVVAVGDFKTRDMLGRIRDLFGKIPPGPPIPPVARVEPEQKGERRLVLEGPGQTAYVQFAYHAPRATDPDFYPMVALDSILAGASSFNLFGGGLSNKSSRLYKALVETELAVSVGGNLAATVDPYLYTLTAVVRAGHTPEEVDQALDAQVERVISEPVSGEELAKALKQARAMFAYSSESATNQGFWLGYTEIFDTYEWFERYLDRLSAVTTEDVQRAAAKYLARRNRTAGRYLPTKPAD
jgi:zinc protease